MLVTLDSYKKIRSRNWKDDYIFIFYNALEYLQKEPIKKELVLNQNKLMSITGYDRDSDLDRRKKHKLVQNLKSLDLITEVNSIWSYADQQSKTYIIPEEIIIDSSLIDFYNNKKKESLEYIEPIKMLIDKELKNDVKNIKTRCKYNLTINDKKILIDYINNLLLKQMNTKITDEIIKYYKSYKIDSILNFKYEPNITIYCTPRRIINKNLTDKEKEEVKELKKSKKNVKRLNSLTTLKDYNIKIKVFVRSINTLCLTNKNLEYIESPKDYLKKSRNNLLKQLGLNEKCFDISASIPCFRQAQYQKTTFQFEKHRNPRYIIYEEFKNSGEFSKLPLSFDAENKAFKEITLRSFFETTASKAWNHIYSCHSESINTESKETFVKFYNRLWEIITKIKKDTYEEAKSFKCFLIESEVINRIVLHLLKDNRLAIPLYDCIYCNELDENEFIFLLKKYTEEVVSLI
jgi:hypothetical protein